MDGSRFLAPSRRRSTRLHRTGEGEELSQIGTVGFAWPLCGGERCEKMVIQWLFHGGLMGDGDFIVVCWWFHGDFVVISWDEQLKMALKSQNPLQVPGEHRKTAGNSWLFIKPPPWKVAETDWGLWVLIIIFLYVYSIILLYHYILLLYILLCSCIIILLLY